VGEPIGSLRALVEDCGLARSRRHEPRRIQLARLKQSTSKNFCTFPVGVRGKSSVWITIVRGCFEASKTLATGGFDARGCQRILCVWRCDDQRTDALARIHSESLIRQRISAKPSERMTLRMSRMARER
jgi:hypothetical protein